MKYTITITDMTTDEYNDISSRIGSLGIPAPTGDNIHRESDKLEPVPAGNDLGSLDGTQLQPAPAPEYKMPEAATRQQATTPAPVDNTDVDANGVPWCETINTKTKGKTAKGIWKRKHGITDEFYQGRISQLKAETGTPVSVTETPPTVQTPAGQSFTDFTNMLAQLLAQGKIAPTYSEELTDRINQAFAPENISIKQILDIAGNERLTQYAWQLLKFDGLM